MEMTATMHMLPSTGIAMKAYGRHNEHSEEVNHENEQLVTEDHELNRHTTLANVDEVLQQHYGKYLNERNNKLMDDFNAGKISLEQYTTRTQTLDEYLRGSNGTKPKKAFTEGVMTVGSLETETELLDKLGFDYKMIDVGEHQRPQLTDTKQRKQWSELWNQTYVRTAEHINDRNRGFKVVTLDMHADEGGESHGHAGMVNLGKTAKGKPSTTFNSALKEFLGDEATNNSKVNLKKYREIVDNDMMTNFNDVAHEMGFDVNATLIRTNAKGGRSMKEYQANKQEEESLESLRTQNKALHDENDDLTVKVSQKKEELSDVTDKLDESKTTLASVTEQVRSAQQQMEKLEEEKKEFAKRKKQLDERDEISQRNMENMTKMYYVAFKGQYPNGIPKLMNVQAENMGGKYTDDEHYKKLASGQIMMRDEHGHFMTPDKLFRYNMEHYANGVYDSVQENKAQQVAENITNEIQEQEKPIKKIEKDDDLELG